MKILISNDAGKSAHYWERVGLARALIAAGHQCVIWDMNHKSSFDAFDEYEPDIFIGQSYKLTPALIECIKERPALRVLMKAGDWGKANDDVDTNKYPVLTASMQEQDAVEILKKEANIDFLFIHYHPDYIEYTHGNWTSELDVPVKSLMNAADVFAFTNGKPHERFECDIMFLGGYWPYKAQVLDKWLLPLCEDFKYKIKIFGNSHWPCPQYCGFLPEGQEANALASAKICINLHEPHSQTFNYDVVERPFKLASNKCFMMSDYVGGLEKSFSKSNSKKLLNIYKTPESMHYDIAEFLGNWENHSSFIKDSKESMYQECIEKHTYFDRAKTIFDTLNLDSSKIVEAKARVIKDLNL